MEKVLVAFIWSVVLFPVIAWDNCGFSFSDDGATAFAHSCCNCRRSALQIQLMVYDNFVSFNSAHLRTCMVQPSLLFWSF